MTRTYDVVMHLITAFDTALSAFNNEAKPGWAKASVNLRAALDEANRVGDVAQLPCPLTWWSTCQTSVRAWLEAENEDVRRGLSSAVHGNIRALSRFAQRNIAEPIAAHGPGVR
jgi:hypothetical protein